MDNHASYPKVIKELMDDIQEGGEKMWWNLYGTFPDSMKGSIAKRLWSFSTDGYGLEGDIDAHEFFSYGTEYGGLIALHYLLRVFQSSPTTVRKEE